MLGQRPRLPPRRSKAGRSKLFGTVAPMLGGSGDGRHPVLPTRGPEFILRRPVGWCLVEAAKPDLNLVIGVMGTKQSGPAYRAEMSVIGCPGPASRLAGDGDLATVPDSKGHERAASLLAACQAMAQPDPHRLATSLQANGTATAAASANSLHGLCSNEIVDVVDSQISHLNPLRQRALPRAGATHEISFRHWIGFMGYPARSLSM